MTKEKQDCNRGVVIDLPFPRSHFACLFPSTVCTKPRRPLLPPGVDSSMRRWLARLLQLRHVRVCAIPGHLQPPFAARRDLRQLWRRGPRPPEHFFHRLEPCLLCVQHGCICHLHLPASLQAVSVERLFYWVTVLVMIFFILFVFQTSGSSQGSV